jgi:hypothetical protein
LLDFDYSVFFFRTQLLVRRPQFSRLALLLLLLLFLLDVEEQLQIFDVDSTDLVVVDVLSVDGVLKTVDSFHFSKVYEVVASLLIEFQQFLLFIDRNDVIESLFGVWVQIYVSAVVEETPGDLLVLRYRVKSPYILKSQLL